MKIVTGIKTQLVIKEKSQKKEEKKVGKEAKAYLNLSIIFLKIFIENEYIERFILTTSALFIC